MVGVSAASASKQCGYGGNAPAPLAIQTATATPLPEGWTEHTDPSTGNVFYSSTLTGETTWTRPVLAPPAPTTAPVAGEVLSGLPGAFMTYLRQKPEILDSIRDFQTQNRNFFAGEAGQEYPLEATTAYNTFIAMVDGHLNAFLEQNGATPEMFADGLLALKNSDDPHWVPFDLLLRKVDFPVLADLLRTDTCLCCGGKFVGPQQS